MFQDPINKFDLDGRCWGCGWFKKHIAKHWRGIAEIATITLAVVGTAATFGVGAAWLGPAAFGALTAIDGAVATHDCRHGASQGCIASAGNVGLDLAGFGAGRLFARGLLRGARYSSRTYEAVRRFGDRTYAAAASFSTGFYTSWHHFRRNRDDD